MKRDKDRTANHARKIRVRWTTVRFQLDARPVSAAALLKAARMGMAWTL